MKQFDFLRPQASANTNPKHSLLQRKLEGGLTSKGVACYLFIDYALKASSATISFSVPGTTDTLPSSGSPYNYGGFANTSLQVDSSEVTFLSGPFGWAAANNGAEVASNSVNINPYTGNLSSGPMMDMMEMPSTVVPPGSSGGTGIAVSYGFYDSFSGASGLTNYDQCYVYLTACYTQWMTQMAGNNSSVGSLPFNCWCLPGAHDAGMCDMQNLYTALFLSNVESLNIENLIAGIVGSVYYPLALRPITDSPDPATALMNVSMTQKDTISTMLALGIRYFDFRPGTLYPPLAAVLGNELFHQHLVVPGYDYQSFLQDVLNFLAANAGEIVVVNTNAQGFASDTMTPSPKVLAQYLSEAQAATSTTSINIGTPSDLSSSYDDLIKANLRLIFLSQIPGDTQYAATKYDSYSDDAYATLNPADIVEALEDMTASGMAGADYTVLQCQGTSTNVGSVQAFGIVTASETSSPLMMTKANFDSVILPWAIGNVPKLFGTESSTQQPNLTILLNDFADNATVNAAIAITQARLGV